MKITKIRNTGPEIEAAVKCLLEKIEETLGGELLDICFDALGKAMFAVISNMEIDDQLHAIDWTISNFKKLREKIKNEFH